MDIKRMIEELTAKIKENPELLSNFMKKPVETLEGLLGIDLPNDQLESIVEGVKAKIKLDDIGDQLSNLGDKLGDFLGK